jgi:hypothetical protein
VRLLKLKVLEPDGLIGYRSEMTVSIGSRNLSVRQIHPHDYPARAPREYFEHSIKKHMADMISDEIMRQIEES